MNRGLVQQAFNAFFDLAACAIVADFDLFQRYLSEFRAYIAELELAYDPVDQWALGELGKAAEFLQYNQQWIAGAEQIKAPLQQAFVIISQHRMFLDEYGLLPDYLDVIPENAFSGSALPSV
ncbi:hypothetical protein D5073_14085 [Pectobacterium versatile]|uniref:hypothetical protein n=1 Tax=Pectobacterium versatile TaxID=2488639 RepID=UPI000B7BE87D|nr:hypothetical protein [Pectobacterium versatile]ASN85814.1 Hypothetical protein SCC1_2383 [Pectobacterium versatile]MBQ4763955.1 hypothetical protein [Pectobacterium versatile]MBQ4794469.1 hypothetical protein [Pectobacterium versatile]POY56425.1 hypothetical protein F018LOC_00360 [Pectobacterium versatile]POY59985.1 hypothetical protein PB70LOC_00467 [Pectobacterium versatile]